MNDITVVHQPEQLRFIVGSAPDQAMLEYRLANKTINFHHTFVPPSMRGKGVAEKLVRAGLSWANEQQLTTEASCSYVQKFLR
ncbi:GNAT family N-acetyltransferase [Shewanella sp. OMA3-2]|uniref:GNAT family N-acetyltransferase n=1 Tax=Shewanella sp. OMA3-2 TaxID=2908650 RepID=UPI001F3C7796|nr:GNAT family N-acetyltransferase [Shewanella sp. OMA3-2]UJF22321.1 N-acetyltransferase [Shewanella sp. OMA3-2]